MSGAMYVRCETLPADPPEVGILYVSPPLAHVRGALRSLLLGSGLTFSDPADGVLAVEVSPDGLAHLSELLHRNLSEAALADCQAVLVEKGVPFGLETLPRTRSLFALVSGVRGGWLASMLRDDRLAVHFQPIVPVADPGDVFAYECLLRGVGEGGEPVGPNRMFETARSAGLLFALDSSARAKAVREAAVFGLQTGVFINFDPASIYDPERCLGSTLSAAEEAGLAPERMVLEVTGGDRLGDGARLRRILDFCRASGVEVALDDLGPDQGSLALLGALRPDFVKLDVAMMRDLDGDPRRAATAAELIETAHDLGTVVIAEGVETPEQLRWLDLHGAHYAQGHLFAKPASPPPVPTTACA